MASEAIRHLDGVKVKVSLIGYWLTDDPSGGGGGPADPPTKPPDVRPETAGTLPDAHMEDQKEEPTPIPIIPGIIGGFGGPPTPAFVGATPSVPSSAPPAHTTPGLSTIVGGTLTPIGGGGVTPGHVHGSAVKH